MSIKLMTMVFDRYQIGEGEKLVALCLADFASDDGKNIFPAIATIAKKTCMTERNVQRVLKKMQSRGWLVCVHKSLGGKPSEYAISNTWINGDEVITNHDASVTVKTQPRNNVTVTLATSNPDASVTQSIKEPPLEPLYNHHITTNAHEALPVWLDVELWNDWLKVRVKLKAQNTPRAIAIILKKLNDWHKQGHNPNSLIETALVNGWKDCYLPRQANSTKPQDDGYADFLAQTERWEAMQGGNNGNHNAIEGVWQ